MVGVIDFCNCVDDSHQSRGAHQGHGGNAAEVGAAAKTDCGLFTIHRDVLEALVFMDGMDKVCDPVVGKASHEFDAALNQLFDDQRSRFFLFFAHIITCAELLQALSSR
jgi:hypothetical protein